MAASFNIVTASWFTSLPLGYTRVGISRGAPRRYTPGYRMLRRLAPGPWFRSVDAEEYVRRYEAEVLSHLDPHDVVNRLSRIGLGGPIALVCFERPGTADGWCHRALVSAWFDRELGLAVPEHGYEHLPPGQHPMLPPPLRKVPVTT